MRKALVLLPVLVFIALPHTANAWGNYNRNYKNDYCNTRKQSCRRDHSGRSTVPAVATSTPVVIPDPVDVPVLTPTTTPVGESVCQYYTTGYSYWDNTPAGTADISNPVIHSKAGGTGTFADPITVAVGHSIISGKDILDYPKGTKFYAPFLRKYFIVEDTCGDGNQPQNGPCHTGFQGKPWIDFYVDGQNTSRAASDSCMNDITAVHTIIMNPGANHPVVSGAISGSSCATNYGETII